MKRFVGSLAVLVFVALPLAAQERADVKPKEGAKAAPQPPRAVYQHTTSAGRLGKFELKDKQGKADYYFNGQHHQDDLLYARSAEMRDPSLPVTTPGWVYQVSRKDKKESLWFFFAADPFAKGGDQYVMFYTTTAPNAEGKQSWTRILTPGGTKRTSLDKKPKGEETDK
ncbi:MAG TPA: hypothetical protein VH643_19720 [Gemmataceae bacterium]|jgi:hypothetical protein